MFDIAEQSDIRCVRKMMTYILLNINSLQTEFDSLRLHLCRHSAV